MEHPILCQQRGGHIQQFVENLDVGNPRMLGCQKYKLDRLLTKALAELPYERGVLTNTFIDDDSFYAGHDRTRRLPQRQRVIHRTDKIRRIGNVIVLNKDCIAFVFENIGYFLRDGGGATRLEL